MDANLPDANSPRFGSEDEEAAWALSLLREGGRAEKIDARDRLAYIFERRGLYEASIDCLESNVRDGVRDPRVYQRLAGMYRRRGLDDLADEALEEARSLEQRRRDERGALPRIDDLAHEGDGGDGDDHPLEALTRPLPTTAATARDAGGYAAGYTSTTATRDAAAIDAPRPWYASPVVVMLAILLLGPFGIALLWHQTPYPSRTKWFISGAWLALSAVVAYAGMSVGLANLEPLIAAGRTGSSPQIRATPPAAGATGSPSAVAPVGSPSAGVVISAASPGPSPSPGTAIAGSPSVGASPGATKPSASGEQVRVVDTGGQGARLRERPSSTAPQLKLIAEATVVEVVGPDQQAEGRAWRNVRDATGSTGWIAAELLQPAS